jgi:hypothetical protein
MNDNAKDIPSADPPLMTKLIMDAFHRILIHYGQWFAEVHHQLGMEKALEVENSVWNASLKNQMARMGKILDFKEDDGVPERVTTMTREKQLELLKGISVNWLANDGIWFQAVEKERGMFDAKRCNDTCWSRFSPFEAARIKTLLDLPEKGGLAALEKALAFRLYALVNEQSMEHTDDGALIFRMNNCRVQSARNRRGLPDYPCKSGGMVEYPCFARAIDPRIRTECIGCPPDEHPDEWFCAWKFTIDEA